MKAVLRGVVTRTQELDVEIELDQSYIDDFHKTPENRRNRWLEDIAVDFAYEDWYDAMTYDLSADVEIEFIPEEGDDEYEPPVLIHPDQGTLRL
jgi:hypothetical protein